MTLAMLAAPAFARFEKIGVTENTAMQTADIANVIVIAPTFCFEELKCFGVG